MSFNGQKNLGILYFAQYLAYSCPSTRSANVDADYASRNFTNIDTEWMLNSSSLTKALKMLQFQPESDLLASRLNKKFEKYCAFHPDPDAIVIDAFSISWSNLKFYSFPETIFPRIEINLGCEQSAKLLANETTCIGN